MDRRGPPRARLLQEIPGRLSQRLARAPREGYLAPRQKERRRQRGRKPQGHFTPEQRYRDRVVNSKQRWRTLPNNLLGLSWRKRGPVKRKYWSCSRPLGH